MIKPECFNRSWIEKLRKKHPSGDPLLIERMIYAFELLGQLSKRENDFVFKGGTSLILLLPNPKRLSIDIDVTGKIKEETLRSIANDTVFVDFYKDERGSSKVPKDHYKFVYESSWDGETYSVLLDYIEDEIVCPETRDPEIDSEFFEVSEPHHVTVPTIEGLIADKMIAYAPETIGIPYREPENGRTNSLRLIKQLHDVGVLFEKLENMEAIRAAYPVIHEKQCEYVDRKYTVQETLKDTLKASELVGLINSHNRENTEKSKILKKGIQQIQGHLLTSKMTLDQAALYASRTAYLAALLLSRSSEELEQFDIQAHQKLLRDIHLDGRFKDLNYLKGRSVETFYYWYKAAKILRST